ncbi:MAG: UDP-N-acetylmuramate dehydrogenase [Acidobacteriota bacterium]
MAPLTTLGVGGFARYFAEIHSARELEEAYGWAREKGLPVLFLGDGSNVLFSDCGYDGLILRNRCRGIERFGREVEVGGAEELSPLICWLNQEHLAGMERMYGIPGTIAGAVVGNAGAYGEEISDCLREATVWSPEGVRLLSSRQLNFHYRHSLFKERRDLFLLSCRLRMREGESNLQAISDSILEKRLLKYPPDVKCPGSFFKNVLVEDLSEEVLASVPDDCILYGKIPAGKLLESVGANGARRGDAQFAHYHGNLLINRHRASSRDLRSLAEEYAARVWKRYGIRLEPEILIVDPDSCQRGS